MFNNSPIGPTSDNAFANYSNHWAFKYIIDVIKSIKTLRALAQMYIELDAHNHKSPS